MAALLRLAISALLITAAAAASPAPSTTAYTNYTVGDKDGWFFDSATNTSAANYSSWADSKTFNLGDFLIFNTNTNQTVIQTFNETTFRSCSIDESEDDDTIQYNGGSTAFGEPLTVSVPLTTEGPNYFFSDADEGFQCRNGLQFEIQVNRGLGLPPSLNQPPPPPYKAPPGPQSPGVAIPAGSGSETPLNSGFNGCGPARGIAVVIGFAVASIALW